MSVDPPSAGERVTYDWGVAVASSIDALEDRVTPDTLLRLSADESTNTSTISDVTGWAVPAVDGQAWCIRGALEYSCAATNQGAGLGFRHSGGFAEGIFRVYGVTADNTGTATRLGVSSADTDIMLSDATVSTAGRRYVVEFTIFYTPSVSTGSFKIRKRLNGTPSSTGLTLYKGSYATAVSVG